MSFQTLSSMIFFKNKIKLNQTQLLLI